MKRRNYYESIREYTRAIEILAAYEQETNNQVELKERAEMLCLRGDARCFVGEYEDSIHDYLEALRIFKDRYGSHHNKPSALAFGDLAKIYKTLHLNKEAEECFKASL
jgi:tetratricopeptide (TPR) repeat protein